MLVEFNRLNTSPGLTCATDMVPIAIGTPPTEFQLLADTGSADTWVGGTACRNGAGKGCVSSHLKRDIEN